MSRDISAREEKGRYLVVGGWNTLFGYLAFAALYELLGRQLNYMLILAASYALSVTNAYFCYKLGVFKTKGNYAVEYFRFWLVYGVAFVVNLATLPFLVERVGLPPLVAQAASVGFTVVLSYLGHKRFSFRPRGAGWVSAPGRQERTSL